MRLDQSNVKGQGDEDSSAEGLLKQVQTIVSAGALPLTAERDRLAQVLAVAINKPVALAMKQKTLASI